MPLSGPRPAVPALAFLPPGPRLLAGHHSRILAWDYGRDAVEPWADMSRNVGQLAASPDGRIVLARDGAGRVRLFDLGHAPNGWEDRSLSLPGIVAAALSRDGRHVATMTWEPYWRDLARPPSEVALRAAAGGRVLARLHVQQTDSGNCLALTDSGDLVVLAVDHAHALAWQPKLAASGQSPTLERYSLHGPGASWGAWQRMAQPQRPALHYGSSSNAAAIAFSEDQKTLATTAFGRVILWDVTTSARLCTFTGHREDVRALAFAPAGPLLASVSADGTLRFWDRQAKKRPERLRIECGLGPLAALAFSPDGQLLAVGGRLGCGLIELDERLLT